MRVFAALLLALATFGPARAGEPPAADERSAATMMDDLMWGRGPIGGPFSLTDPSGARRSAADFRGKIIVLYFGYTHCPDVCPLDLYSIARALDELGEAGARVQPLFVTLDPERDSPAVLADYVAAFHPRLIGLTGTLDEVRSVAAKYKAWFAKGPERDGDYAVDHSGVIYLIGADGEYLGYLPPQTGPDRIAAALRSALGAMRP